MNRQCSSCGGFCKKSGCERENVTIPPKREWVGLTDEEVTFVWHENEPSPHLFARAIEAKLKEKNSA